MGRQRINLSAVDFSQQMLITGHSAQFPVPVCSGLNTPLSRYNWKNGHPGR